MKKEIPLKDKYLEFKFRMPKDVAAKEKEKLKQGYKICKRNKDCSIVLRKNTHLGMDLEECQIRHPNAEVIYISYVYYTGNYGAYIIMYKNR